MTSNTLEKKKREPKKRKPRKPNIFIIYRKNMMKCKPYKMSMTDYSKLVSKWWKDLPKEEKAKMLKEYHIDRDTDVSKSPTVTATQRYNNESSIDCPICLNINPPPISNYSLFEFEDFSENFNIYSENYFFHIYTL